MAGLALLLDRAAHRWGEARLAHTARGILRTAPLRARDDGLVLFSMIGTRVLLPYLVAVKSLHAQLGRGRIALLDDGTLTAADKALLAHHCDNPQIVPIGAIDTGAMPQGGCWERLCAILDLRREAYVIQLDSDTVTMGPVPEVAAAVAAGRCFTLRGGEDSEWRTLPEMASLARGFHQEGKRHVQWLIEAAIDEVKIAGYPTLRYVRGCAGFAGFAPAADGRALAQAFNAEAQRLVGPRWSEWGSEQVASNFVVANAPGAVLLPYERYLNYWRAALPADAGLVHFLGTHRYHGNAYANAVRAAIAALPAG